MPKLGSSVLGTAYVDIPSSLTVSLSPATATLGPGQQQIFVAASNPPTTNFTYTPPPLAYSTVNRVGNQFTITANSNLDVAIDSALTVVSGEDPTKSAQATVKLRPNVSVSVNAPDGATPLRPNRPTKVNATVTGARDTSVEWDITPNIGTIAPDGWYTAPSSISATQTITVRAVSVVDRQKSASTTLTLKPPVTVSVSPSSAGPLIPNATQQFTATVTGAGSPNTAVYWSVMEDGYGTISSTGLYTAPSNSYTAGTIHVRARSVEDPDPSTDKLVNVALAAAGISVSPSTAYVYTNQAVQFSASLAYPGTVPPITWGTQTGGGASIDEATGLFTSPSMITEPTGIPAIAQVTANPTNQSIGWVYATPPPALWLSAVDPINGNNPTQAFNFRARDYAAPGNIDTMTVTFKTLAAAQPECQIVYTISTGNIRLFQWAYDYQYGQWYIAAFYNGQVGGPLSGVNNGACAVTSAYASTTDGYDRSLTLGMTFTPNSVPYQVFRAVTNLQGISTGTVMAGTWRTQPNVTIAVAPTSTILGANGQQQFGATISGTTNTAVTWSVISGAGAINSSGRYTAPASVTNSTVTVRATSVADPTKSADATISLQTNPQIVVNMLTPTGTITAGQTYQLGASVTGTAGTERTWSIVSGAGSVSAVGGLYTAPAVVATSFTATIRATSVADPSKFATATLTVNPSPVTISVSPTSSTLNSGTSAQFTATVGGTANTAVTWAVSPSSAGSVTTTGYFTAASVSAVTSATLTATSVADNTKSASAALTIQPQSPVTLVSFTPTSASGLSATMTLTARSTQTPVSFWLAIGDPFPQPPPYYLGCSFHYSGATAGLAWWDASPGSASSIANGACTVTTNSVTYDPVTGNRAFNVTVTYYSSLWGTMPIQARISSPSGSTNWTTVGTWIP